MEQITRKPHEQKHPTERSELEALRHEIRVLRKKFKEQHKKDCGLKEESDPIRLDMRIKGPLNTTIVTLVLNEVPRLDSALSNDMDDLKVVARRVAEERKQNLGYKRLLNVYFTGKEWQAKFEQ